MIEPDALALLQSLDAFYLDQSSAPRSRTSHLPEI
jgi:hypothetical protein